MKKNLILTIIVLITNSSLFSQDNELRINVSSDFIFLSEFENHIHIVDQGMVVPGIISPENSEEPPLLAFDRSSSSMKPGFSADLELFFYSGKKWKFSSSAGIAHWNYSYDNTVGREDLTPLEDWPTSQQNRMEERYNALDTETLSKLSNSYGQIQTLYLEVKPFNVSMNLLQAKMFLQAGPIVNFLLSNDHNDYAIEYNEGAEHTWDEIDNVYFSSVDKFHDIIPGIHFKTAYNVMKDLSLYISGELFFHATFSYVEDVEVEVISDGQNEFEIETTKIHEKGPLPFKLQGGLQYNLWRFGD